MVEAKQVRKIAKTFKRPVKTSKVLFQIAFFCHKITPIYSAAYRSTFSRALRLCRQERFTPAEAFRLGLLNPALSDKELPKFLSRKKMTKIQKSLNPESWAPLLKNKGIFYRYCTDFGIPIPKLYAIFFRRAAGWAFDGSVLRTRDDWQTFFDTKLPREFVIKPAQATRGQGVNVFSKSDNGFVDASGKSYKGGQLYDAILSHPEFDGFVIQQRLTNHPKLINLSDTHSLQTIRFTTFVDNDGNCRIPHAFFKPIAGQNLTDNFEHGLTGNLMAEISLDTGTLKPAIKMAPNGLGREIVPKHPRTGHTFDGFELPFWTEACSLLKDAATKFLPVRTIGWDVALTPNGPFIVEANIWWDPPNQHRCMDVILDALSGSRQ